MHVMNSLKTLQALSCLLKFGVRNNVPRLTQTARFSLLHCNYEQRVFSYISHTRRSNCFQRTLSFTVKSNFGMGVLRAVLSVVFRRQVSKIDV